MRDQLFRSGLRVKDKKEKLNMWFYENLCDFSIPGRKKLVWSIFGPAVTNAVEVECLDVWAQ